MQDVAFQKTGFIALRHIQAIVWVFARPLGMSRLPKPKLRIRVPTAVTHPLTTIRGQSVHPKTVYRRCRSIRSPRANGRRQFRAERFVRIQGKEPLPGRLGCGPVLLLDVPFKRVSQHPSAALLSQCNRPVGGSRIHHEHLICYALQRIQATRQVVLLIEGNDYH